MNHRRFRISRLGLPLVVVAAGCVTATTADARGPRAGIGFGTPQGPIFKTLDTMAGGIEYVLERTVLAPRRSNGCDAKGCDDACDALTLQQLDPMAASGPHGQMMPMHPHHLQGAPPPHPSEFGHSDDHQHLPTQPLHAQPMHAQPMHAQPMHAHPMHAHPMHAQPTHAQPMHAQPMQRQPFYGGQGVPRGLPRVPSDDAPPPPYGEDGWIESFNPTAPQGRGVQRRRSLSQDEQYDSLPNPFLDDPQGGR